MSKKGGLLLALMLVLSGGAVADDTLDEQAGEVVVPQKKQGKAVHGQLKLDRLRAELGVFTDEADHPVDMWLHGAAGVKWQFASWDVVLGARFDTYGQSDAPGFERSALDYAENYLRWHDDAWRVTVGAQNILWGRVDDVSPIDRMSRMDLSRVMLDALSERRRAVPAVRVEYLAENNKLDLAWLPVFTAAVLPHDKSRWHPVNTREGRLLGLGDIPALAGMAVEEDEHGSGGVGVRWTHAGGRLDYGLSLQRVRQSQPYYQLTGGRLLGVHPFSWVAGVELEAQKMGATWRAEGAWSSDVPVTNQFFQYRTKSAWDVVLASEFFPGDSDLRATVQFALHQVNSDEPILDRKRIYNVNGELEQEGNWRAGVRFTVGMDKSDWYLNPKISYLGVDQHEFYAAAHWFNGGAQTLGGYYDQNDMVSLGWLARF